MNGNNKRTLSFQIQTPKPLSELIPATNGYWALSSAAGGSRMYGTCTGRTDVIYGVIPVLTFQLSRPFDSGNLANGFIIRLGHPTQAYTKLILHAIAVGWCKVLIHGFIGWLGKRNRSGPHLFKPVITDILYFCGYMLLKISFLSFFISLPH